MTPERWQDVERLFHAALERPPGERAVFLRAACAGDEALQREVQTLLDESSPTDGFLESPVFDAPTALVTGHAPSPLIGRRLSEYELQELIGAGGMGEVYRARDLKLGRSVAIKVLPALLTHDVERVARFRREAQILATLNHPHIAAIYALEESEGMLGLVLELVEGPTLADRISEGPLAPVDALRIARQMADALEAAHAKGIIHRDLKPANIKLAPGGRVKVLDFGLAKATDRAVADATALATVDATREGMILGTAAYMSPEQARGMAVDERTDIWAFGCVLYEALTGRRTFSGTTAADCVAAILEREVDWALLPPGTPTTIVRLLEQCLDKNPLRRLPDISAACRALDEALSSESPRSVRPIAPSAARKFPRAAYVAAIVLLVIAAVAGTRLVRQMSPRPERLDIGLGDSEFIAPSHSSELAISPDGTLIAYATTRSMSDMPRMAATYAASSDAGVVADMASAMPSMTMSEQIYVRSRSQAGARPIGGALGGAPFFSPDGKWLGFWHAPSGTLRKVALSGGAPVRIGSAVSGIAGAAWGRDDEIVFAWFDLFRVPASGGSPKLLLKVDEERGERFYRHPSFLPSGRAVLFTIGMADTYSYDDAEIGVLSIATGEKKILVEGGSSPRYSPSGHLVYARGGDLLAVPFDPDRLDVLGQPFRVADGVFMSANTGMAAYSISSDGHLVYAAGPMEQGLRRPVFVDRQGRPTPVPLPPRSYLHPRLSPDERQLTIEVEGASHDIFAYDFARGTLTKMSFDGASHWPSWTPDGRRLTFRSWKTGTMTMWWMPADQSGPPELLTEVGSMQSPESWSPDGRALAFTQMDDPERGSDIYVLPLDGDRRPYPLVRTKFSEGSPKFSPDGRWLAYASNKSGRPEVYAMAYPGPGPETQVSTEGGTDPLWRPDGGELYYRAGDRMMVVDVTAGDALTLSKPRVLWEGRYMAGVGSSCGMAGPTSANYDVTADGQRFLMIEDTSETAECRLLRVVANWSTELRNIGRAAGAGRSSRAEYPGGLAVLNAR
jgi:serine/threonine-protein kinase